MQDYIIAHAKRIADLYGEWVRKGYTDRHKRLERVLRDVRPDKIKEKAKSLIKYRYDE